MSLPEAERTAAIARIGEWYGQHARAGRIIEGRRLSGRRKTTTVRRGSVGRSGKPLVTDGPYAETKETFGVYANIEAPDREAAVAIAATWPGAALLRSAL